jgi:hypothetical protein
MKYLILFLFLVACVQDESQKDFYIAQIDSEMMLRGGLLPNLSVEFVDLNEAAQCSGDTILIDETTWLDARENLRLVILSQYIARCYFFQPFNFTLGHLMHPEMEVTAQMIEQDPNHLKLIFDQLYQAFIGDSQ